MAKDETLGGFVVHPAAKLFPLMVGPEFDELVGDIERRGQAEPILTWRDGKREYLLDGRNRLRACLRLDRAPLVERYEGDDPAGHVVSLNLHRRHLSIAQRAMIGGRLIEVFEGEAQERHRAGSARGGQAKKGKSSNKVVATRPQPSAAEPVRQPTSRDRAAQAVGVSGRSVQRARKVIEHGIPGLQALVDADLVTADVAALIADRDKGEQREIVARLKANPGKNAKAVLHQFDKDQVVATIESELDPPPDGPFRVIMVDFSWMFAKRAGDATQRGQTRYPPMSQEEIVAFSRDHIARIAHDDCILWMWITNAHLVKGDHVAPLAAAGFDGRTMLSWDKELMGVGDWLRGRSEHCILAVKGHPTVKLKGQSTVLEVGDNGEKLIRAMVTEKRREPGRKPEVVYDLVEDLCPGSKVELFSRTDRQGWACWGAEAGQFEPELGL